LSLTILLLILLAGFQLNSNRAQVGVNAMQEIAIVRQSPVLLDREKTIELAVGLVEQAVANGARLFIFSEVFISWYPAWIWRLRPGSRYLGAE